MKTNDNDNDNDKTKLNLMNKNIYRLPNIVNLNLVVIIVSLV